MVPRGGLEPPRLAAPDFESGTSTNSITGAGVCSGKTALKQTKRSECNKKVVGLPFLV